MVKIINASFSKCGTKSMSKALRILGLKVHDVEETFAYHSDFWVEYLNGQKSPEELKAMLYQTYKNVDAVCDLPCYFFWKEFLEVFPNCKVLLSVREEDPWWNSMKMQFDLNYTVGFYKMPCKIRKIFNFLFSPRLRKICAIIDKYWATLSGYKSQQKALLPLGPTVNQLPEIPSRRCYRSHNADVLKNCPPEKLLVINGKQDFLDSKKLWTRLSVFLEIDEKDRIDPSTEFPYENRGNVSGQNIVDQLLRGKGNNGQSVNLAKLIEDEIGERFKLVGFIFVMVVIFLGVGFYII